MSGEALWFYRPNVELAAALRDYRRRYNEHVDTVVTQFTRQFPDHPPIVNSSSEVVIGFKDGKPKEPPPEGLSRSNRRDYLIPVRQAAGQVWRDRLVQLQFPLRQGQVFDKFKISPTMAAITSGRAALYYPNFLDFGDGWGGVIVYCGAALTPVPDALTLMKRSEFYALQEAYDEGHEKQPPAVWEERLGVKVLDPDGWRGTRDMPAQDWDVPVTRGEFVARLQGCTMGGLGVSHDLEVRQKYWDEAQRWLASLKPSSAAGSTG